MEETWIAWLVTRRRPVALAAFLFALALCAGLPRLRFDASNQGLFLENDPTLLTYRAFLKRFGTDEVLYVLVEPPADPFSEPTLAALIDLGLELKRLPHATGIRSPLHSRVTYLEDGALVSRSVAEVRPTTPDARATWRARVLAFEPFRGILISADARYVGFSVQLERDLDHAARSALLDAVQALRARAPLRDWPHAATGTAINPILIGRLLQRELRFSVIAATLVAIGALALLFRSPLPVGAVLLQLVCTVAPTLGLMGHLGVPLSSISAILVTLLACVGLADCMHMTAAYERLARGGLAPERAAATALHETWWPCLVTSLTNVGGFLALCSAPLRPIVHLGLFAAVGTALAYLAFLGLAPWALCLWAPRPTPTTPDRPGGDPWTAALLRLSRIAIRRPWPVLVVGLAAFALLSAGIPPQAEADVLRDLRPAEPLRRDLEFVHARMGGTITVEVVVEPRDPQDPELLAQVLRRCERLQAWLSTLDPAVRSVRGIVDGVREVHTLYDGPREVPADPNAVAQLLLVLQSADSDWYTQHLTISNSALRITVRCDLVSSRVYERIIRQVEDELPRAFAGPPGQPALASAYLTGGALLLAHSNDYVVQSQLTSFGWSLLTVAVIVLLSVRSLGLGLVSLVPNVGPVVALLGLMGWFGIPLEISSALIATVALGIVVDDTVHVVHSFAHERRHGVPVPAAIERVLARTGRAVLFTSLVLVTGFATYLGSDLRPIRTFGWLAAATFLVAFLADLLILPALLRVTARETGPPTS